MIILAFVIILVTSVAHVGCMALINRISGFIDLQRFPLCLQQLLHGTLCLENTSELHTFAELQLVLLAISAAGSCEAVQELVAYAAMKERGSFRK